MPDFSMCEHDTCARRALCRRNAASGTKPDALMQAYFAPAEKENGEDCNYFWQRIEE